MEAFRPPPPPRPHPPVLESPYQIIHARMECDTAALYFWQGTHELGAELLVVGPRVIRELLFFFRIVAKGNALDPLISRSISKTSPPVAKAQKAFTSSTFDRRRASSGHFFRALVQQSAATKWQAIFSLRHQAHGNLNLVRTRTRRFEPRPRAPLLVRIFQVIQSRVDTLIHNPSACFE